MLFEITEINKPVFLATWNDNEIVEIHSEATLRSDYGSTNLFDDGMYWFSASGVGKDFEKLDDLIEFLKEYDVYFNTVWICDNASIQRIK